MKPIFSHVPPIYSPSKYAAARELRDGEVAEIAGKAISNITRNQSGGVEDHQLMNQAFAQLAGTASRASNGTSVLSQHYMHLLTAEILKQSKEKMVSNPRNGVHDARMIKAIDSSAQGFAADSPAIIFDLDKKDGKFQHIALKGAYKLARTGLSDVFTRPVESGLRNRLGRMAPGDVLYIPVRENYTGKGDGHATGLVVSRKEDSKFNVISVNSSVNGAGQVIQGVPANLVQEGLHAFLKMGPQPN